MNVFVNSSCIILDSAQEVCESNTSDTPSSKDASVIITLLTLRRLELRLALQRRFVLATALCEAVDRIADAYWGSSEDIIPQQNPIKEQLDYCENILANTSQHYLDHLL